MSPSLAWTLARTPDPGWELTCGQRGRRAGSRPDAGGPRRIGPHRCVSGRPPGRFRRDRRAPSPHRLSVLLSVRRQPRGRERSDPGCVSARVPRACGTSRATRRSERGSTASASTSASTGSASKTPSASRSSSISTSTTAVSRRAIASCARNAPEQVRAAIAQLPREAAGGADSADVSRDVAPGDRQTRSAARSAPSRRTSFTRCRT